MSEFATNGKANAGLALGIIGTALGVLDAAGGIGSIMSFSPQLAQWLLQNGYQIVDIKPKHDFPRETVFVFAIDGGFQACIEAWLGKEDDR